MSEGTPTSAAEALWILDGSMRHEDALQSRTEGLTWVLWGLSLGMLVLAWDAASALLGGLPDGIAPMLVVPPLLLAGLATYALWRGAALTAPAGLRYPMEGVRAALAYVAGAVALFLVVGALAFAGDLPPAPGDAIGMIAIGGAWLATALLTRLTPRGARVLATLGALALAAGLVCAAPVPGLGALRTNGAATLLALATLCAGPALAGAWQALRG